MPGDPPAWQPVSQRPAFEDLADSSNDAASHPRWTAGRRGAAVAAIVALACAGVALSLTRSSVSTPVALDVGSTKELYDRPSMNGAMEAAMDVPTGASGGCCGGLAPQEYRQLTAAEWAQEEQEARAFLANGGPPGNGLHEGVVGRRLEREALDHQQILRDMLDNAQKAAAYFLSNQAAPEEPFVDKTAAEAWKKDFEKVAVPAKPRGDVAGCQGSPPCSSCNYELTSMFLMHRQFKPNAKRVNTIAVLTDTSHAVSCGDDGLCWVWKIRSGYPRQVFPEHKGPVNTVTVMTDSMFVMSGGADSFDSSPSSGTAFVWDWRGGFEHKSFTCPDGSWLASTEFAAWRIVGLGCSSNFTYIWDWGGGAKVKLPFTARDPEEVKKKFDSLVADYAHNNLEGHERLFLREPNANQPDEYKEWLEEAKEEFEREKPLFHPNNFGAVNTMAYVPSHLRFVTGHEDGKVRYWNSDSGVLIRTMSGHQGPVHAVAATPTNQEAWSGGQDGTIRLWNLKTGTQDMMITQKSGGAVLSLTVMPGGQKIAVGSADGYVRIYKRGVLEPLCAINTGGKDVRAIAVNPSNPADQLLVGGADGYVRVYTPHR